MVRMDGRLGQGAGVTYRAGGIGADERGIPKKAEAASRQPRALPPRRSGGVQVKGTRFWGRVSNVGVLAVGMGDMGLALGC